MRLLPQIWRSTSIMSKSKVLAAAASFVASGSLILGVAGADLIKTSEGKVNRVYSDAVGVLTVCYGHTSPLLRKGMTFTDAECDLLFRSDVIKHQAVLVGPRNCIKSVPLTGNQLDALTSLTFNIGNTNFCKSTLARKLSVKDYDGASKEFGKWKYAKGRVLTGLVIRRAKEQILFNSPAYWQPYSVKQLVSIDGR